MKNKFTLNIPNPCSADWDQMDVSAKSRFCSACQTTVIDFSNLDDVAIKEYFQNSSGKVCGRFRSNQLKEYALPAPRRSALAFLSVLGLTSLMLPVAGLSKAHATFVQETTIPELTLPVIKQQQNNQSDKVYTITGKITDKADNQPLPGVVVLIKGTNYGTTSQADGSFKLQVNDTSEEKITLTFNFIGYETQEKEISFTNSSAIDVQEINLKLVAQMLGGVVYVGQVTNCWYKPKNLWWRLKGFLQR